jgi:uncharacterized protein (DUF885 family)
LREGVKAGVVQPRVLMEKVLPQLDANIVDDVEKSIFWGPITNMPKEFSAADRERLTAAFRTLFGEQILPSYKRLRGYIADEYLPKTRDTFGMGALPNGAAWYAHKVHDNTTHSMTPAQVHQIGLDEVARIQDGMRAVAKDLGYTKPVKSLTELKAFFEWMKARNDMYFSSREELLAAYQKFHTDVDPAAAEILQPCVRRPTTKCGWSSRSAKRLRRRASTRDPRWTESAPASST